MKCGSGNYRKVRGPKFSPLLLFCFLMLSAAQYLTFVCGQEIF